MPAPESRRVQQLEAEIAALREDVKQVKLGVDQVNGHIADILSEIGGAPDRDYRDTERPTMRKRLHELENDKAAARIATQVLDAIEQSKSQAWTRGQKIGLFAFACVGCLIAILNLIGVG